MLEQEALLQVMGKSYLKEVRDKRKLIGLHGQLTEDVVDLWVTTKPITPHRERVLYSAAAVLYRNFGTQYEFNIHILNPNPQLRIPPEGQTLEEYYQRQVIPENATRLPHRLRQISSL